MGYQNKSFEEMAANKFGSNNACCKEIRVAAVDSVGSPSILKPDAALLSLFYPADKRSF